MTNPLFVLSPLYVAVVLAIAVLVAREYLKFAGPKRQAVQRRSHRRHDHHQ